MLFEDMNKEYIVDDETGSLYVVKDFIEQPTSLFNLLLSNVPWQQEYITMFGKTSPIPRKTAWYSKAEKTYRYSGISQEPFLYNNVIEKINKLVEHETGSFFNSVLMNLYSTGEDKVSWHRDNEPDLGETIHIASVSLGAERDFQIRRLRQGSKVITINASHGSLIYMKHPFQRNWEHCVPVRKRVKSKRINLTFRFIP